MDTPMIQHLIRLRPGHPLLLRPRPGSRIHVLDGCAWITQYGHARDLVLSAGQQADLEIPAATVLSSHRGARLVLSESPRRHPRPWWRRLLAALDPRWSSAATRGLNGRLSAPRIHADRA